MADQVAGGEAQRIRRRLRSDGAETGVQEPAVMLEVLPMSLCLPPCPGCRSCDWQKHSCCFAALYAMLHADIS